MANINKILSGKEFNDIYKGHKFVKILADEYKTGLNIDSVTFNPTGICSASGLYFTDLNNTHM